MAKHLLELTETTIDTALASIEARIKCGDLNAQDGSTMDRRAWLRQRPKLVKAGNQIANYSTYPFEPGHFDTKRFAV